MFSTPSAACRCCCCCPLLPSPPLPPPPRPLRSRATSTKPQPPAPQPPHSSHPNEGTCMQTDTTVTSHQDMSTDPRTEKSVISTNNGTPQSTSVPKRPPGDGEYHQRSHSAAMGPMGANENHGPVRGRQSPPHSANIPRDDRASFTVNGNHDSHHDRRNNSNDDLQASDRHDDDHDEDDDMEGHDENGTHDSEEENVDELMDEGEFEDGEGQDMDDGDEDGQPGASWDSRQGAPRNNRPLQARPSGEGSMNNGARMNGAGNGGETSNGSQDPSMMAGSSSVNNGSSKKRTTPAKHKCPQCDKYFTRPFNLKSHQRTHTQERPFVCSFAHCARAFSRLHDCNRHMRTHWRIKPYSCPECHRNFVRQDALTRHLRLDFGHNRCTGYPGPSPGSGASNQEKTEDNADDPKPESANDGSSHPHSAPPKLEGGSATGKAGPFKSTSPTSPTHPSPVGHTHPPSRIDTMERDGERPVNSSGSGGPGPMHRVAKPIMPPDLAQPKPEPVEEREQLSRRDPPPHSRYQSVSFVHIGADRGRPLTPPDKEGGPFLHHMRTASQPSPFSPSQPSGPPGPLNSAPLTPQPSGPTSAHVPPGSDRRNPPTASRNGAPWGPQGHDPTVSEYYPPQAPSRPPPPGHIITRQDGPYEYDRQRPLTAGAHDYPSSPHEPRRSPPHHGPEWNAHGQEGSGSRYSWDNRPQGSGHRPTWPSGPGRGTSSMPHPQDPGHHPPIPPQRASTVDSWQRNPSHSMRETREDLAREPPGPIRTPRTPTGYPTSPYSADSGGSDGHSRSLSGASSSQPRFLDQFRRTGSWSERRSYHDDKTMRYESHPSSPQHVRGDGPPLPHGYGPERSYPPSGPYHERDHSRDLPRDAGAPPGSTSAIKDPTGRDRPVRTHSAMEFEADREAYRVARYSGDGKPLSREGRRSASPGPHRHPGPGPYEGNPGYPYPPDRAEPYTREDMPTSRTFTSDDRLVMSPIPREDQGGYFSEPGRSSLSYRSPGYPPHPPPSAQRPPESPHHYSEAHPDSARRERHSMDMPMATTTVGPPPPAKRTLTAAPVATR